MLTLITITFKILYTLLLSCLILFLSNRSETNLSKNKHLLMYALSLVSILSILYKVDPMNNSALYSIGVLSIFLITIILVYVNNNEIKDYLIINFLIISISLGYVFISLIVVLLYVLIDKYYIYIEEYLHFESFKNDDS